MPFSISNWVPCLDGISSSCHRGSLYLKPKYLVGERSRMGGEGEGKMAYFERKRILALSGLTTNKKARDLVLRIIIEYNRPNPFT